MVIGLFTPGIWYRSEERMHHAVRARKRESPREGGFRAGRARIAGDDRIRPVAVL